MREVFDNLMKSVYTAMPATVLNVHEGGKFVDVMPVIEENNGRINNVLLVFPQSKKYGFRWRVEEKDEVLLITSKYPLDNLYTRKEESRVEAGQGKQFQYGECFAIPCINQFGEDLKQDVELEIVGEKASIVFTDNDGLKIDANCSVEITAKENVDIDSKKDVEIKAAKEVKINATGKVEVKSAMMVNINADAVINLNSIAVNITGGLDVTGSITRGGTPLI